jgi:hypothetical protein
MHCRNLLLEIANLGTFPKVFSEKKSQPKNSFKKSMRIYPLSRNDVLQRTDQKGTWGADLIIAFCLAFSLDFQQ